MKILLTVLSVVLAIYSSSLAFADTDGEKYWRTIDSIEHELSLPLPAGDASGLFERRQRLRQHFSDIPPQFAGDLFNTLQDRSNKLAPLFFGELATATRDELLWILYDLDATLGNGDNTENHTPQFFSGHQPLPDTANTLYHEALENLRGALSDEPETGGHQERQQCWLEKLEKANVDDRIIKWETICPRTSMASSPFVTSCNIQFPNVAEDDLKAHIKKVGDVEAANQSLFFMTHLRPEIINSEKIGGFQAHNFRLAVEQSWKAISTLDKMANSMGLGAGSAMPHYFRAIAGWIGERQNDPRSVLSCF